MNETCTWCNQAPAIYAVNDGQGANVGYACGADAPYFNRVFVDVSGAQAIVASPLAQPTNP